MSWKNIGIDIEKETRKAYDLNRDAQFRELAMLDIELTPLELRVYDWGRDNWKQLVDLLDNNITEETIVNYMLENKCEELPIQWVVNLISPSR